MKKNIIQNSRFIIVFLTLILIFSYSAFSQKHIEIDQVITLEKADSLREFYVNKQSLDTAFIYANQTLKIAEEQYGKNDTIYANMLKNVFEICYYSGKYQEGLEYLLQEKEIRDNSKSANNTKYITLLGNLALIYESLSQYNKAELIYIDVIKKTENTLGKLNTEYITYLVNLADLYESIDQINKSLVLYTEALGICEKVIEKDNPIYAATINNLAFLYLNIAQYKKALPLFEQTLDIIGKSYGKEHPQYGMVLSNLGLCYMYVADDANIYEESIKTYKKSLALLLESKENTEKSLGKEHPLYGYRLITLGNLYMKIGNKLNDSEYKNKEYNKALKLFTDALSIIEKSLGKESIDYCKTLDKTADLYRRIGEYKTALNLYLEANKIFENIYGKEHSDYGRELISIASLYLNIGQISKASEDSWEMYKNALPYFKKGMVNINNNTKRKFNFLSEKEKEVYLNSYDYTFYDFNTFALQTKDKFNDVTSMVYNNTIRNKGILLKSSTAMRIAILGSKDTLLINKYSNWITLKKEIVKLYSIPVNKRLKDITQLEEQASVIERSLVSSSQEFSSFTKTLKINWKDVQKSLNIDEVAIEFIHFKLRVKREFVDTIMYCALIITKNSKYPEMIPLFEEKQLEKIIGKFGGNNYSYINSIYGKNTEVNKELYNLIWKPMEASLKGAKKVYLSPDGLLHKISFSAIAKKQNVYLCDAYDIEVKSSTGKITEQTNHRMSKSHLMNTATLFGGITYNTDSTKQEIWSYLEGTKTETQKIDKILRKGKVSVNYFSNTTATEEEFKLMATNSNILHIATHGFFYPDPNEIEKEETGKINAKDIVFRGGNRGFGVESFVESRNPLMRSGLIFAGANDVWSKQNKGNTDDGVLTAQEVANIDMRKTDLVVMSACETGLGDIKGSEGVYGLQRAFKMAGVKYEIMSLWQVPDKETEEFMTIFYKKLIKQKDIKQAFAQTQKEMRKKYDPYFWAAFVLIE